MTMEREKRYECSACGEKLSPTSKSCPNCGSDKKRVFIVVQDTICAYDNIIEKSQDQLGKIKRESKAKKRPATSTR